MENSEGICLPLYCIVDIDIVGLFLLGYATCSVIGNFMVKHGVVVIGGGLSGLWAASLLHASGVPVIVLEARNRLGGRALSISLPLSSGTNVERFDLGGSWFWPEQQPHMRELVARFGLTTFPQYVTGDIQVERFSLERASRYKPSACEPTHAFRFRGGVQSVVDEIAATFPESSIWLSAEVTQIGWRSSSEIVVQLADSQQILAGTVILAIPPRLVARGIAFDPPLLPPFLRRLHDLPTWVGAQAKAVAVYSTPFWRAQGLSGMASSFLGPLQEIHDASGYDGLGALMGFSALSAQARHRLGEESSRELILAQLGRLFGPQALRPVALLMKDWAKEPLTSAPEDWNPVNHYPQYGLSEEEQHHWGGRLVFAGSELSNSYGGYLEGAVAAASRASRQVLVRGRVID